MSLVVNKLRMRLKAEHQVEKCGQSNNLDFLLIFKQMTLINQETGYTKKKKKKKNLHFLSSEALLITLTGTLSFLSLPSESPLVPDDAKSK